LVVTASSGLAELLGYAGFTLSRSSAATVAALIWLRRREGAELVPLPGWPVVPGLFLVATASAALLMVLHEPRIAGVGLLTLLAGLPVYWAASRSGPFWAGASVARSER
ncbi:MAG: amino acid permease, partial [Myxococcota bacterium]